MKAFGRIVLVGTLVAGLLAAPVAPAEAALVYTRDGRVFDGKLKVDPTGLVLAMAENRSLLIPYDQIVGISLDGQPIYPPPKRAEESRLLNSEPLVWALVAANAAAVLTVLVNLMRSPAPAR